MAGRESPIRSYRDLDVWQVAMDLSVACYVATKRFLREEIFGLTSQIRRASSSVPANIADGYGRGPGRAFSQFLRVAQGSLKELETHVILSERVGLLESAAASTLISQCDRIGWMLRNLIVSLPEGGTR